MADRGHRGHNQAAEHPRAVSGYYGKVPVVGDFIGRGWPREVEDALDPWLRAAMRASQDELQRDWLEAFLVTPVWHFAVSPGVAGGASLLGVMMPSVDRVGRYFPLTIGVAVPVPLLASLHAVEGLGLFEAAEGLALSTLDPGFTMQAFDAAIAALPVPDPEALADILADHDIAADSAAEGGTTTVWWTKDRDPQWRHGLPDPAEFTSMFMGHALHPTAAPVAPSAAVEPPPLPPHSVPDPSPTPPPRPDPAPHGATDSTPRASRINLDIPVSDPLTQTPAATTPAAILPGAAPAATPPRAAPAATSPGAAGPSLEPSPEPGTEPEPDQAPPAVPELPQGLGPALRAAGPQSAVRFGPSRWRGAEGPRPKLLQFTAAEARLKGLRSPVLGDVTVIAPEGQAFTLLSGLGQDPGLPTALSSLRPMLEDIAHPFAMNDLIAEAKGKLGRANAMLNARAAASGQTCAASAVALLVQATRYAVIWAGNAQAMLLRNGALEALNRPHLDPRLRNIVTRALGAGPNLGLDTHVGELAVGDRFVLMSPGLVAALGPQGIGETLSAAPNPQKAVFELTQNALISGATLDASAIAVFVGARD